MRRAARALAGRGIPVLVLKGLPLAQRLYGTPFARGSVDIDLLVPPDAVTAAERALIGAGWRRSMPDFRETPLRTRWYETLVRDVWLDGPGGRLELHRRLLGNPFVFDPPFADLAGRGATVTLGGRAFPTLGDADQLLYLACHGLSHYWARLKWLCDLAALLGAMHDADIETAVARGRAEGLDAALAPALTLCREALHVEPPRAASALRAGAGAVVVRGAPRAGGVDTAAGRAAADRAGGRDRGRQLLPGAGRPARPLPPARGVQVPHPADRFRRGRPARPAVLPVRAAAAGALAAAGATPAVVRRAGGRRPAPPPRRVPLGARPRHCAEAESSGRCANPSRTPPPGHRPAASGGRSW